MSIVTYVLTMSLIYCSLEVPFIVQPEAEFQSLDAVQADKSWLEMPLKSDRPIPVRCAVGTMDLIG